MLSCLLLASLMLAGCTSAPQRIEHLAEGYHLERMLLPGRDFTHVAYYHRGRGRTLHVYLEGDGRPWIGHREIALDPTPRHPLMLHLMAEDPAPRLYLGRPCYLGRASAPHCRPYYWTHGRYSEAVVESMAAALAVFRQSHDYPRVVLLGHSGGGTLAMLLAARVEGVAAVVTLAGNLDVAGWTAWHGYLPLNGSLDPTREPPLPGGIRQWHLSGAGDEVVPPELTAGALPAASEWTVLDGVGHREGWREVWPCLLERLMRRLSKRD